MKTEFAEALMKKTKTYWERESTKERGTKRYQERLAEEKEAEKEIKQFIPEEEETIVNNDRPTFP